MEWSLCLGVRFDAFKVERDCSLNLAIDLHKIMVYTEFKKSEVQFPEIFKDFVF